MTKSRAIFRGAAKIIAALILITLYRCADCAPAEAANFAATSPWIGFVASFIGGNNVKVRNLSVWDASGRTIAVGCPRSGEIIIALDPTDAARMKIRTTNPKLRLLYDKLSLSPDESRSIFFDPAGLPFVAQNVMKIIAGADSAKYAFYQRRLAEFQSRIDSTIDMGRYMLSDVKLLDLTGSEGVWVRAAVPGAVRPPAHVWKSWLDGDTRALNAALAEAKRRKWHILLDLWTPEAIRSAAVAYENRITLPPPSNNREYFTFLHDIFIEIRNKVKPASSGN